MSHRIAWITGASTGIGAETARRLAREGWTVAMTARTAGKLDIIADEDPKFLKPYPGDVTKAKEMKELVELIETELGPIDLAILNAGIGTEDSLHNFTATGLKKQFEVNVFGVATCLEPFLPKFIERNCGHLAITASIAGYRGLPGAVSYSATKAALINMAESLAIECLDTNVKVQVICPGFVKTPMTDQNKFEMPMLMEADKAAQKLVAGLKSKRFEINFPWAFCWFMKLIGLLPAGLYFRMMRKMAQNQKPLPENTPKANESDQNKPSKKAA